MAKIPTFNPIHAKVEQVYHVEGLRPYLGYSVLGHPCNRYLWYYLHWCFNQKIDARLKRLFSRGDYEEEIVTRDLVAAGMEVHSDQHEVTGCHGHVKGHIDGFVDNVPGAEKTTHLLEVKTMNDKRFKEYQKKGLEATNPGYYAQIQSYMGKTGKKRCLFVVTNKNDEQRDYQRLNFDKDKFDELESRGTHILMCDEPPDKIGGKTWHECKFCNAKKICHYSEQPLKNCRTCEFVGIENDGKWSCGKCDGAEIRVHDQRQGCDLYQLAECLK